MKPLFALFVVGGLIAADWNFYHFGDEYYRAASLKIDEYFHTYILDKFEVKTEVKPR